ncbi:MAG: hypothetical protein ABGZ53_07310 [Fuerstiella sp.]
MHHYRSRFTILVVLFAVLSYSLTNNFQSDAQERGIPSGFPIPSGFNGVNENVAAGFSIAADSDGQVSTVFSSVTYVHENNRLVFTCVRLAKARGNQPELPNVVTIQLLDKNDNNRLVDTYRVNGILRDGVPLFFFNIPTDARRIEGLQLMVKS